MHDRVGQVFSAALSSCSALSRNSLVFFRLIIAGRMSAFGLVAPITSLVHRPHPDRDSRDAGLKHYTVSGLFAQPCTAWEAQKLHDRTQGLGASGVNALQGPASGTSGQLQLLRLTNQNPTRPRSVSSPPKTLQASFPDSPRHLVPLKEP